MKRRDFVDNFHVTCPSDSKMLLYFIFIFFFSREESKWCVCVYMCVLIE